MEAKLQVEVPEEVRKYKERIMFGLTARQLIAVVAAGFICAPLYFYAKKYIPDDVLSWIIILIACPIAAFGFVKYDGMNMEQLLRVMVRFFLAPSTRKYETVNRVRETEREEKQKEEAAMSFWGKKAKKKYDKESALEKTVLMVEAAERGEDKTFDPDSANLLTVRAPKNGKNKKNNKGNKDNKPKEKKKSKEQVEAEAVQEKIAADPHYIPTKKENKALSTWNNKKIQERKQELSTKKKVVQKKNKELEKRRNLKSVIPKNTVDTLPIIATYPEGIFEVAPNKYSKMYELKDVNYDTAETEERNAICEKLGALYNYFPETYKIAIYVDNRVISMREQENRVYMKETGDDLDIHRREYNGIICHQFSMGNNNIQISKYMTITIDADAPLEAQLRFRKIDNEVDKILAQFGSRAKVIDTTERLSYFHDKFRVGHEGEFNIDYPFLMEQEISELNYIAPMSFDFKTKSEFQIDGLYYRILYLDNLPASLSDVTLQQLYATDFPTVVAINVSPVAQRIAIKTVRKQLAGAEHNQLDAQKRAVKGGYSPDIIRQDLREAPPKLQDTLNKLTGSNQKMFYTTVTVMVQGKSLEELDENCTLIENNARAMMAELRPIRYNQEEAFKITLPFGYPPDKRYLALDRTLLTDSLSIFMPFRNVELFETGGYYYGLNAISKNLVVVNRLNMKTPSGFILGSSGSGKSFATKREILNIILHDNKTNVLIIDPENEYRDFCRIFGGTIIKISAVSEHHINPMDMPMDYGLDEDDDDDTELSIKKEKALSKKSAFIMSIVERMISVGNDSMTSQITPQQRSVVDEAIHDCYKDYLDHDFDIEYLPTLLDFQNCLDKQGETNDVAAQVAQGVQYYTRGSMSVFAHKTNINIENRLMVFSTRDIPDQLQQVAFTIVFDFIWNRMVENKNRHIRTFCYCDEIHVMFKSKLSASYLQQFYKRGRKYGLCITGITQNVSDLLVSEQARGMIGNSDFILMLNQNTDDFNILAKMLNISNTERGYVTNRPAGEGLLFAEKVIVPVVDKFPSDSYLYRLMSTKFGEETTAKDIQAFIDKTIADARENDAKERALADQRRQVMVEELGVAAGA
jgi:type IV secretory pathway VirB4 component